MGSSCASAVPCCSLCAFHLCLLVFVNVLGLVNGALGVAVLAPLTFLCFAVIAVVNWPRIIWATYGATVSARSLGTTLKCLTLLILPLLLIVWPFFISILGLLYGACVGFFAPFLSISNRIGHTEPQGLHRRLICGWKEAERQAASFVLDCWDLHERVYRQELAHIFQSTDRVYDVSLIRLALVVVLAPVSALLCGIGVAVNLVWKLPAACFAIWRHILAPLIGHRQAWLALPLFLAGCVVSVPCVVLSYIGLVVTASLYGFAYPPVAGYHATQKRGMPAQTMWVSYATLHAIDDQVTLFCYGHTTCLPPPPDLLPHDPVSPHSPITSPIRDPTSPINMSFDVVIGVAPLPAKSATSSLASTPVAAPRMSVRSPFAAPLLLNPTGRSSSVSELQPLDERVPVEAGLDPRLSSTPGLSQSFVQLSSHSANSLTAHAVGGHGSRLNSSHQSPNPNNTPAHSPPGSESSQGGKALHALLFGSSPRPEGERAHSGHLNAYSNQYSRNNEQTHSRGLDRSSAGLAGLEGPSSAFASEGPRVMSDTPGSTHIVDGRRLLQNPYSVVVARLASPRDASGGGTPRPTPFEMAAARMELEGWAMDENRGWSRSSPLPREASGQSYDSSVKDNELQPWEGGYFDHRMSRGANIGTPDGGSGEVGSRTGVAWGFKWGSRVSTSRTSSASMPGSSRAAGTLLDIDTSISREGNGDAPQQPNRPLLLDAGSHGRRADHGDAPKPPYRSTAFGSFHEVEFRDDVFVRDQQAAGTDKDLKVRQASIDNSTDAADSAEPRVTQRRLLTLPVTWTTGRSPPLTPRTMRTYSVPNSQAGTLQASPRFVSSPSAPPSARGSSGLVRFVARTSGGMVSHSGKPPLARRSLTSMSNAQTGGQLPPAGSSDGGDTSNHSTHEASPAGRATAGAAGKAASSADHDKSASTYTTWWRFLRGMMGTTETPARTAPTSDSTAGKEPGMDPGQNCKEAVDSPPAATPPHLDEAGQIGSKQEPGAPWGSLNTAGLQVGMLQMDSGSTSAGGQSQQPSALNGVQVNTWSTGSAGEGQQRCLLDAAGMSGSGNETLSQRPGSSGPGTQASSQIHTGGSASINSESTEAMPWDGVQRMMRPSTAPPATNNGDGLSLQGGRGGRRSKAQHYRHHLNPSHPPQTVTISHSCPTTPSSSLDATAKRKKRTRSPLNTSIGLKEHPGLEIGPEPNSPEASYSHDQELTTSPRDSLPSASPPPADEGAWLPWSSTFSWFLKRSVSLPHTASRSDTDAISPGQLTSPRPTSANSHDTVLVIGSEDTAGDVAAASESHNAGAHGVSAPERVAPHVVENESVVGSAGSTGLTWFLRRVGAAPGTPEASGGHIVSATNTSQTSSLPPLPTSPTATLEATPSGYVSPASSPELAAAGLTIHQPDECEHPLTPQNTVRDQHGPDLYNVLRTSTSAKSFCSHVEHVTSADAETVINADADAQHHAQHAGATPAQNEAIWQGVDSHGKDEMESQSTGRVEMLVSRWEEQDGVRSYGNPHVAAGSTSFPAGTAVHRSSHSTAGSTAGNALTDVVGAAAEVPNPVLLSQPPAAQHCPTDILLPCGTAGEGALQSLLNQSEGEGPIQSHGCEGGRYSRVLIGDVDGVGSQPSAALGETSLSMKKLPPFVQPSAPLQDHLSPFAYYSTQPFAPALDAGMEDVMGSSAGNMTLHSRHPSTTGSQSVLVNSRYDVQGTPLDNSTPTGDSPSLASLCTGATVQPCLTSITAESTVDFTMLCSPPPHEHASQNLAAQQPMEGFSPQLRSSLSVPPLGAYGPPAEAYPSPRRRNERHSPRAHKAHSSRRHKLITEPSSAHLRSYSNSAALLSSSAPSQLMRFSSSDFSHLTNFTHAEFSRLSPAELTHVLSHWQPANKSSTASAPLSLRAHVTNNPAAPTPPPLNSGSTNNSSHTSARQSGQSSGLSSPPIQPSHVSLGLTAAPLQASPSYVRRSQATTLHTSPATSPGVLYTMFAGFQGEVLPKVPPLAWQAHTASNSASAYHMADDDIPPAPQPTPANTPTATCQNSPWSVHQQWSPDQP